VRRDRILCEPGDLGGLADIDAMHADLLPGTGLLGADLGGERPQARFVAIGQREIAAACRKFKHQRAPNTAGSAGDGNG
jgi:hypothetical protein